MSSALCPGYALIRSDGSPGLQEALSAASNFIITNSIHDASESQLESPAA